MIDVDQGIAAAWMAWWAFCGASGWIFLGLGEEERPRPAMLAVHLALGAAIGALGGLISSEVPHVPTYATWAVSFAAGVGVDAIVAGVRKVVIRVDLESLLPRKFRGSDP